MTVPRHPSSHLAPGVRRDQSCWQDDQTLAVLLAMGDALAALKYQDWAGLRPVARNLLGFDPADRNAERANRTLDWLEAEATPAGFIPGVLSVQDIALSTIVLWTEARGGFPWRGRPRLEAIVAACSARSSFTATTPQPWP
jgi:glutathione S-transferase